MKIYTVKEAEARVPGVVKLIAREAIDLMWLLETHTVNTAAVEGKMFSIQGYANHLIQLGYKVWRQPVDPDSKQP